MSTIPSDYQCAPERWRRVADEKSRDCSRVIIVTETDCDDGKDDHVSRYACHAR